MFGGHKWLANTVPYLPPPTPTGAWVDSPACQPLLRKGINLKQEFTRRVSNLTSQLTLAAWEDGLMDHDSVPFQR